MKSRNSRTKVRLPIYLEPKYSRQLRAMAEAAGLPAGAIARGMVQKQLNQTLDALTKVVTPEGTTVTRVG